MEADWSLKLDDHAMDCAFHPERKLVAAGLVDGTLRMFDFSGAQPSSCLSRQPHKDSCRAVTFSRAGSLLISGAADQSLVVFDFQHEKELLRLEDSHDAAVTRVCSSDENCFVAGDENGVVSLWDQRRAEPLHSFSHHTDGITDFALHPGEACVLAASSDGSVSVLDLRKLEVLQQTDGDPDDEVTAVAVLKNGRKVLSSSMTGVLTVHDWGKLDQPGNAFPGHPNSVDALETLDDDSVVTGSGDGVLRVVSILPNKLLGVLGEDAEGGCDRLALSADRALLASISYSPVLNVWDLEGSDQEEEEEETGQEEAGPPPKKARKSGTGKPSRSGSFFDDLL